MMDQVTQIKKSLITRIENSEDLNFLNTLQSMFDATEKSLYPLTPEQISSIDSGREEIIQGKFHKNNELFSSLKEWLKKK